MIQEETESFLGSLIIGLPMLDFLHLILVIGFLEAFIGSVPFLGQRYVMFATFSFIIAVLIIRPRGISGLLDDTRE